MGAAVEHLRETDTLAIGDDKSLDFDAVPLILSRIVLALAPSWALDEDSRGINNSEYCEEVVENLIAFGTAGAGRKKDSSRTITARFHKFCGGGNGLKSESRCKVEEKNKNRSMESRDRFLPRPDCLRNRSTPLKSS
jgi:hypothetical protein